MIVEDSVDAANALAMLLKYNGMRTIKAGTVREAMIALKEKPSWVLLDLMLPDGDGSTVLLHIREQNLPIKVAIVSGCGDEALISEVRKMNPNEFLPKPVNYDLLMTTLKS